MAPIARHYARVTRESADDLTQVGLLGLLRAAELYVPSRGEPFEPFARRHIRGAILHYLRDQAPLVRIPRRRVELDQLRRRCENRLQLDLGQAPPSEAVRQAMGLSLTRRLACGVLQVRNSPVRRASRDPCGAGEGDRRHVPRTTR